MDHFYQYTYTDIGKLKNFIIMKIFWFCLTKVHNINGFKLLLGAMVALCDVNEYRHAVKLFKVCIFTYAKAINFKGLTISSFI